MNNTFGSAVTVTVFGESHGASVGAVIDGMPSGVVIDEAYIAREMGKRRSNGDISTPRKERDCARIVSGVFNGRSTGTPLCLIIDNENTRSGDYDENRDLARPGHADYTAQCRYNGYQDYRGGGHFSGRITAGIVAAGAIFRGMLESRGIKLGTGILSCGGVFARPFTDAEKDIDYINSLDFPALVNADKIKERIREVKAEGDSVGGVLQTAVTGLPAGVGEPLYDSFEGMLGHALFSVPAVKGVEFGAGFGFADMLGSEANDGFYSDNGVIKTYTNNNGGINGGITNGMPVLFNTVVKPTPSVFKPQKTVNIKSGENSEIIIKGRHDPAIIHRAAAAVNAVTAHVCVDMLCRRYGIDYFGGAK